MNREEREVTDINEIEEILHKANILRIALCEKDTPYIIPVNFGYNQRAIYIHSSKKGKKIDILNKNNNISFEVEIDTEIVRSKKACNYTMKYKSVIGFGKAFFVHDFREKKKALDTIMSHYSSGVFDYPLEIIEKTCIIRIDIESMTGKKS